MKKLFTTIAAADRQLRQVQKIEKEHNIRFPAYYDGTLRDHQFSSSQAKILKKLEVNNLQDFKKHKSEDILDTFGLGDRSMLINIIKRAKDRGAVFYEDYTNPEKVIEITGRYWDESEKNIADVRKSKQVSYMDTSIPFEEKVTRQDTPVFEPVGADMPIHQEKTLKQKNAENMEIWAFLSEQAAKHNIRSLRIFGKKAGLDQSTFRNAGIEINGSIHAPSLESMLKVFGHFKISMDEMPEKYKKELQEKSGNNIIDLSLPHDEQVLCYDMHYKFDELTKETDHYFYIPISKAGFSPWTVEKLEKNGLKEIGDFRKLTKKELRAILEMNTAEANKFVLNARPTGLILFDDLKNETLVNQQIAAGQELSKRLQVSAAPKSFIKNVPAATSQEKAVSFDTLQVSQKPQKMESETTEAKIKKINNENLLVWKALAKIAAEKGFEKVTTFGAAAGLHITTFSFGQRALAKGVETIKGRLDIPSPQSMLKVFRYHKISMKKMPEIYREEIDAIVQEEADKAIDFVAQAVDRVAPVTPVKPAAVITPEPVVAELVHPQEEQEAGVEDEAIYAKIAQMLDNKVDVFLTPIRDLPKTTKNRKESALRLFAENTMHATLVGEVACLSRTDLKQLGVSQEAIACIQQELNDMGLHLGLKEKARQLVEKESMDRKRLEEENLRIASVQSKFRALLKLPV